MLNFKTITLELYNQEVKITFKPGTECFNIYGRTLEGKLVGRIWGERFDDDSHVATVIGITIKTPTQDVNVSSNEIENIEKISEE